MPILPLLSIFIEVMIFLLALQLGVIFKRRYGYAFALTFALYIAYDLSKIFDLGLSQQKLSIMFLVASLSALYGMNQLQFRAYAKEKKGR